MNYSDCLKGSYRDDRVRFILVVPPGIMSNSHGFQVEKFQMNIKNKNQHRG